MIADRSACLSPSVLVLHFETAAWNADTSPSKKVTLWKALLASSAATARACRHTPQGLFPQGYELVYDNYNALVFAFASTDRASGAILSNAVYPRWVTRFFAHGVDLSDPQGLCRCW